MSPPLLPGDESGREVTHHPTALVLVDFQVAFFSEGALAQVRDDLVERANRLVAWARQHAELVVNVRTEHRRDRSTWTLNMVEDDQGFAFAGDEDAAPLPGLDVDGAIDLVKTRDDAFHGTRLAALLAEHGIDTLVVAGVSTHSCVAATVNHAYADDLAVVLVHDAIASGRPHLHEPTLELLADEFRLPRLATDEVVAAADGLRRRVTI